VPAVLDKILRAGEGRMLRRLKVVADRVNALEDEIRALDDEELRAQTESFRDRLAEGETLDDLLPEAFATVREAARRTLGQRHFDVQIMGGAALHLGNIAEMRTGEGKTLVATLPAYLNALAGDGVHVITVNDYLAQYQAELMGRVYHFLGLTSGVILSAMTPEQRRVAYAADITYGTNNEFGFDYLRDNMAWTAAELVQRGHHFAVVDEVDSILIDEARTPLIISGPAEQGTKWYAEFARIADRLRPGDDYEVDIKKRTIGVNESGITRTEDHLGIDNLYDSVNTPLVGFLNNAVKAKELFHRDKDYVVIDREVLIVDEHTGRILAGRRYNEGMHQAIEAKEHVDIKDENQTLATITLQNFFRLYEKLSGMTGTAMTEANEFNKIYELGVVQIPTNKPMVRVDEHDLVYRTEEAKFEAVVEDIAARHAAGQPVLVGTVSVEKSELLSRLLGRADVPHEVLNAKHHAQEAAIVAQAGRRAAVTVATNMAGRGTDIMLGGSPEFVATAALHGRGLDPDEQPEAYEAAWPDELAKQREAAETEHEEVVAAGGLYVLGTERHESRRIDNQLRGRSGRQGDPGESRFYLSLQDELMRRFKSEWVEWTLDRLNSPVDVPIESKSVSKTIASAQAAVEGQNFESRKDVLKYDDVLNRQRKVVYAERRRVLEGGDVAEQIRSFLSDVVAGYVRGATSEGFAEEWDVEALWTALALLYPVGVTLDEVVAASGGERSALTQDFLLTELDADVQVAYDAREADLGPELLRDLERRVLLSVLDRKWREHLYEMDYLRDGIYLRAMAQRDPLVEYQREGFDLFTAMMDAIKEESVGYLFHLEPDQPGATPKPTITASSPAVQLHGATAPTAQADDEGPGDIETTTDSDGTIDDGFDGGLPADGPIAVDEAPAATAGTMADATPDATPGSTPDTASTAPQRAARRRQQARRRR